MPQLNKLRFHQSILCFEPCRPDCTRQVTSQGRATTHKHTQPTLPARPHSASHWSGKSQNTQTHAADPAGQTAVGKSLVREEQQHTNTCSRPCRSDHSRQVTSQGRVTTHKHTQPTLPARPHLASHRSGKSHNTQTHAADPAGQTALGRSPVREVPQHTNTQGRPDRTRLVTSQGRATTCSRPRRALAAVRYLWPPRGTQFALEFACSSASAGYFSPSTSIVVSANLPDPITSLGDLPIAVWPARLQILNLRPSAVRAVTSGARCVLVWSSVAASRHPGKGGKSKYIRS